MGLNRRPVTVDHGIYGKSERLGLCAGGLAVVKLVGRRATWVIYHEPTGLRVGAAGNRATLADSKRVMIALLKLPIAWADTNAETQVAQHLDAVRSALATI